MPEGLTREEWWYAVRAARASTARPTPFVMKDGTRLTFNLPDRFLQLNEEITAQARGQVELPGEVATQGVRDRYLINSLYEEAITSSQMEGASTTRRDANKILREKRDPRTRSERMILNNVRALEFVRHHVGEELTPEFICGVHKTRPGQDQASLTRLINHKSHAIRVPELSAAPQTVAIPTTLFRCLKCLHGNCMRHF